MEEYLKEVPLFAGLPAADLQRLSESVREVRLAPGEMLFAEGQTGSEAYLIRSGELEIIKRSGGREVLLAVRKPGEVIGEMALLQAVPRTAGARARTETVLLAIAKEQFDGLISQSLPAARTMFYTVVERWLSTVAVLRQSEKMAQLGTLTAGVAHELNNPAAAVKRGAEQLQEALGRLEEATGALERFPGLRPHLPALTERVRIAVTSPVILDPVARSDRESEMEEWLQKRGLSDPWEVAPTLVSLGFSAAAPGVLLDAAAPGPGGPGPLAALTAWLCAAYAVRTLLHQVSEGASRISGIVSALKGYAYLDQAPVQSVDIREGLENTLLILNSKLKGVTVRREYDEQLGRIEAYGSELNQVWTNLIDNAADAVGGAGTITLRARREAGFVTVEVENTGPGIPPEIQDRVWEPFFTTKPPGKGTGLGLEISYNIAVHRHKGEIGLTSRPGRTCFTVRLPIKMEK